MWRRDLPAATSRTAFLRLFVPTEHAERLRLIENIHDPEKLNHHALLAHPVIKAGNCLCSLSGHPLKTAHRADCIYYDNPHRCFCEICTGQSPDLREVCTNSARFGVFEEATNKPCRRNHCYTREEDHWRCTRCGLTCYAPNNSDSYVEEVVEVRPPPQPTTNSLPPKKKNKRNREK